MVRAKAIQIGDSELDSRSRILAAALHDFAERGFDGATTRHIAARAGVNQGLIKYYFDGKLKLWRASVDCAFEELRTTVGDTLGDATLIDETVRTRNVIKLYVRFIAAHPAFIRMMYDEGKRSGPRMRWLVDRHIRPLHAAITAMLEHAQVQGLLPADIPAVHFLYIMIGSIGLIFHQSEECKRLAGIDPTDESVADAHADAVARMLLGPPVEETPA